VYRRYESHIRDFGWVKRAPYSAARRLRVISSLPWPGRPERSKDLAKSRPSGECALMCASLEQGVPGSLVGESSSIKEVPVSSTDSLARPPLGGRLVGRGMHLHRAIRLSQVTIAWSLLTGLSAVAVGIIVGGLTLAGYGLNAIADGTASVILLHRFHTERQEPHRGESLERRAGRLVGVALFVISLYLGVSAIRALATHHSPDATALGVAIAVAAMIVLPPLAIAKRRTAARLRSAALRADGVLTAVAAALALGALLGLVLGPAFGWWWADAVIALALVGVLVREAWSILRHIPPGGGV
jgi:Cation efflux family